MISAVLTGEPRWSRTLREAAIRDRRRWVDGRRRRPVTGRIRRDAAREAHEQPPKTETRTSRWLRWKWWAGRGPKYPTAVILVQGSSEGGAQERLAGGGETPRPQGASNPGQPD